MYNIVRLDILKTKKQKKYTIRNFQNKIPSTIQKVALRKLMMIDAAEKLSDLIIPPANHLESLSSNMLGKWSIRINDQWRIVFVPLDGGRNYDEVEIVDYH